MTLKSDPNFEAKLTFCWKNDMLGKFNLSSGKSENLHFNRIFLSKCVMLELKKYRRVVS